MRMRMRIEDVRDPGKPSERIVMKVLARSDLGEFAVLEAVLSGEEITSQVVDAFWFPDKVAHAGDRVILYTKNGQYKRRALGSGKSFHFFYWCSDSPKWGSRDTAPVLLRISEWEAFILQEEDMPLKAGA